MKRIQLIALAIIAALVALEAVVYAQPAPNNCGLNMLCRIRTLVVSGNSTMTGDVTADHFHSTCAPTENAFNAPEGTYLCMNDPTCTASWLYDGTSIVGSMPLSVGAHDVTGGNFYSNNIIPDGGSRLCLNGTGACTVYIASDGFGGIAAAYGGGYNATGSFGTTGAVSTDDYVVPKTGLKNTATSAACSGNTGAVCVNDTGGLAVADGAGTTVATISAAGLATVVDFTATATTTVGTITLNTGTGTATVKSGAKCVCTDSTANASVKCAVSTTTLTATGTGSDVIVYFCGG